VLAQALGFAAAQRATALALEPGSAPTHFQLALVPHSLGRTTEAEVHYREAVRLDPSLGR